MEKVAEKTEMILLKQLCLWGKQSLNVGLVHSNLKDIVIFISVLMFAIVLFQRRELRKRSLSIVDKFNVTLLMICH